MEKVVIKKVIAGDHEVFFSGEKWGRLYADGHGGWIFTTSFGSVGQYQSFVEARKVITRDEELHAHVARAKELRKNHISEFVGV